MPLLFTASYINQRKNNNSPVVDNNIFLEAVTPENDPPLEALLSIVKIIKKNRDLNKKFNSSCLIEEDDDDDISINSNNIDDFRIQPPLALCGRIINCLIWEKEQWDILTKGSSIVSSSSSHFGTNGEATSATNERAGNIHVGNFIRLRNVQGGLSGFANGIPCEYM